jgi:microcystin-dependent protein
MSNYVKSTNFAIKDSLVTTDPSKIIKGTDIDNEYNAISNAIASKADTNSPSLTGTPTAPTATSGSNTNQLANTNFVTAALAALVPTGIITLWSGAISAVPVGWAFCNGTSGTPDLRDRFVVGAGTTYAVGDTGGANSVTLDATMIPSHTHSVSASGTTAASGDHTHTFSGTSSGQSVGHTHTATVTDPGHWHQIGNSNGVGASNAGKDLMGTTFNSPQYIASATTGITVSNGSNSVDHTHTYSGTTSAVSTTHTHTVTVTGTSGSTGGGLAHENRPPYYALAYIMKL